MYLKALEIYGFKSFAEKTTFKLEPGIIAIVGPNGCGKSNVFDAIKWALGEQSPKTLRGYKMEDVIFNGSSKAEPLNYAEVTLIFSNEDGALNIDFSEVSITRKLFRSGESQYFLNKNQVRLKDIQELLSQVGLGEGSYSFIQQGKIEHIITARPETKRVIFDEAAGILHYKEKKKETQRRLEETEANLERVNDIISEVKRQKDSLERQVARARKYEELFGQLKEKAILIAKLKISQVKQKRDSALDVLAQWEKEKEAKENYLRQLEGEIKKKEEDLERLRQEEEEKNASFLRRQAHCESLGRQIEMDKNRQEELRQQDSSLANVRRQYEERIKEYESKIEEVQSYLAELDKTYQENQTTIKTALESIALSRQEIKDAEAQIKKLQEDVLAKESEKTEIANSLVEKESYLRVVSARAQRLKTEVLQAETEINSFLASFQKIKADKETASSLYLKARSELNELLQESEDIVKELQEISASKVKKEKEISALLSKLELVKEAEEKYEGLDASEKVKIIFSRPPQNLPSLIMAKLSASDKETDLVFNAQAKIVTQQAERIKSQIEALQTELKAQEESEKEKTQRLEEIKAKISAFEQEIEKRHRQAVQLEQVFASYQEKQQNLEDDKEVLEVDLQAAEQEKKNLEAEIEQKRSYLNEKEKELALLKEEISSFQKLKEEKRSTVENLERQILEVKAKSQALLDDKASKEANLEVFKEEKARLESFILNSQAEDRSLQEKIKQLAEEITRLEEEIKKEEEALAREKQEQQMLKKEKDSLFVVLADLRSKIQAEQPQKEEINKKITEEKMALQSLSFEEARIREELSHDYQVEIKDEDLADLRTEKQLAELEAESEELKRKIKYLGRVNLVALDEYEELSQRYEFLDSQRKDILTSKESLQKAIYKINRISKQMFIDTLEKIQVEFRKNFRFLFGEGNAKIVILDEENVLDSGIDIVVQPPGKNLQSISLLSGGEKSLTAIALIFSIFKIKPSPLCVLDEIDAPLDEANIDRFNNLLEEFSAFSQFIVITHSKKTMSKASIMYGVTMQKEGVSQVVSVKLSETASQPAAS